MAKRYIKLIQVSGDKEREIGTLTVAEMAMVTTLYSSHQVFSVGYSLYEMEDRIIPKLRGIMSAARQFWPEEE